MKCNIEFCWKTHEKGCYIFKNKVIQLVCRTCYLLHGKPRANKINRLLRHDGKEWFTKKEGSNKELLVLINKEMLLKC